MPLAGGVDAARANWFSAMSSYLRNPAAQPQRAVQQTGPANGGRPGMPFDPLTAWYQYHFGQTAARSGQQPTQSNSALYGYQLAGRADWLPEASISSFKKMRRREACSRQDVPQILSDLVQAPHTGSQTFYLYALRSANEVAHYWHHGQLSLRDLSVEASKMSRLLPIVDRNVGLPSGIPDRGWENDCNQYFNFSMPGTSDNKTGNTGLTSIRQPSRMPQNQAMSAAPPGKPFRDVC